jgi:raffinose/stachyose/melibiose transport system permease protein
MPIMKPIIITVVMFNAIYVFNEYPFASTFITDTSKATLSMMSACSKASIPWITAELLRQAL